MLRFVQIRNKRYENRLISLLLANKNVVHKKYGYCFYKEKLHTNGFCLFCFLEFARRIFYPALFTLLYFIILVVAIQEPGAPFSKLLDPHLMQQ
jgi:uncharacterized membrane protein YpjA